MIKIGYALCGSFCTIQNSIIELKKLIDKGYDVYPILSPIVCNSNTRFTNCEELKNYLTITTGKDIICSIFDAEPIGPKKMFDVLVVCPCTSNTLAKLCYGITDTCVTMAVKSHLRNDKPVVIALASNDSLASTAKNIGYLLNRKNYYFVPLAQDDPSSKPRSMIADFDALEDTIRCALTGEQILPIVK